MVNAQFTYKELLELGWMNAVIDIGTNNVFRKSGSRARTIGKCQVRDGVRPIIRFTVNFIDAAMFLVIFFPLGCTIRGLDWPINNWSNGFTESSLSDEQGKRPWWCCTKMILQLSPNAILINRSRDFLLRLRHLAHFSSIHYFAA